MKLTVVSNHDDWEALYVEGKLWTEGHHLTWKHLAQALGIEVDEIYAGKHLEQYGSCPSNLEDLQHG